MGESTHSLTVKIDKTALVITHALTPLANGAGWNNAPVTVTFTCSDPANASIGTAGSGIAICDGANGTSGATAGGAGRGAWRMWVQRHAAGGDIDDDRDQFTTHEVTVRAGDHVAFVDPSKGGGAHNLYFGNHGQFIPNRNGPGDFNSKAGVRFNPGDTKTYTFAKSGVYEVTCATQPLMNVIITVN